MTTQTLTQQFAAKYAEGVVPAMLKQIKAAKRDTRLIVAGVLAITYPHQALYLTHVDGMHVLGWAVPAVVDLTMLRMLGIVQTTGMRRPAKVGALVLTGCLAVMSAAVNIAAPAALMARAIFGALVLIAAGVKIVTSLVGPDFAAIEATETKATEVVAPVKSAANPNRSEAAKKAAETRKAKAAEQAAADEARRERRRLAAQIRQIEAGVKMQDVAGTDAPVSPAGAGSLGYL